DTIPPVIPNLGLITTATNGSGQATMIGTAGSVEGNAQVRVTNTRTNETVTVTANADGSFTAQLGGQAGDTLTIVAIDAAGNTSTAASMTLSVLPPDPTLVAPPINRTVATDIFTATAFLYSGTTPIQTGVAPGTIERRRAAVARGQVSQRDGTPLSGVTIAVLSHPEFGQTVSRVDGKFDLVVNGGGPLTFTYTKAGYLSAQRQVDTPWRDYALLPDVVLIALDSQVTPIDLTATTPIQVARGSVVTDSDGTRQATLLFPQGTTAQMVLPDGSAQPLTTLHVRATEYTIGANGPKAMPAPLPPTSGYTYAVELSVDEALANGKKVAGKDVLFSQAVPFYVDNFLNFPVGGAVPVGYYDNDRGTWIPWDNGRVIKIFSITGGTANLDTNGDNIVDTAAQLSALGITLAERQQLATLYSAGKSLWRVALTHFSTWDHNWPYGPPNGAEGPEGEPEKEEPEDDPCEQSGSIIQCENQSVGEEIPLPGSPFRLHYDSKRSVGRKSASTIGIPLSGTTLPSNIKRIDLTVQVAGQVIRDSVTPAPNLRTRFTWDGRDVYGRVMQGEQPIVVTVGYVYDAVYMTPAAQAQAFAAYSGVPLVANPARQELTVARDWSNTVGGWNASAVGLGGWSLTAHHVYDPMGHTLHLGNGRQFRAQDSQVIVRTVAGGGATGSNDVPATQTFLNGANWLAAGPDGSFYISEGSRIRKVAPNGIISVVVVSTVAGIALGPDGSVYFAVNAFQGHFVRKVSPDGTLTTIAGVGSSGSYGDGGPATQAALFDPRGIAVGPDGSVYIADQFNHRVRKVSPDGIIHTVAGGGAPGSSGDGGPATQAGVNRPFTLALGPDGSLYIGQAAEARVRRVSPDGIITTVAGNGTAGWSGDLGPATAASISDSPGLAVGVDGSLFLGESTFGNNNRIRRVRPDGIIMTVAGTGDQGFSGDDGVPLAARFSTPKGLATTPDGALLVGDVGNRRVRRMSAQVAIPGSGSLVTVATGNSEVHQFSEDGRHLRTVDALTGSVRHAFTYDNEGRLERITDADNNVTTIMRAPNGTPTAIVGPHGQQTTLTLDAAGYVASTTNTAGERYEFGYS
ncbi:MAG: hypothetical protein HOP18_05660, partial [Deltaproteobacteria bacterium]|nr:hypothetical protein [Deltaproteobacteria bacterium]